MKIWITSFISIILIMGWQTFKIFVLNQYDPKLGITGTFTLLLLILSAFAFITALSFSISFYIVNKRNQDSHIRSIFIITLGVSVIQNSFALIYFQLSNFYELIILTIGWFFISFIVGLSIYKILYAFDVKKNKVAKKRDYL